MMSPIRLIPLEGFFTIHRFPAASKIPQHVFENSFISVCKTDDELSVVCDSGISLDSDKSVGPWSCLQVVGPLDFSLTGILAGISASLASAGISIFAISTFDTDYILVNANEMELAQNVLIASGYSIIDP